MDFEHMQQYYRWVKETWQTQDDATKVEMVEELKEIYHSLTPGERGFMTHLHELERQIEVDLEGHRD